MQVRRISAILLAGQGSTLRPVIGLLRTELPHAPIIDRYRDHAVARGLARMAGIFEGNVKDVVLLDTCYRVIGTRGTLLRDAISSEARADLGITASTGSKNILVVGAPSGTPEPFFHRHAVVPTRRLAILRIDQDAQLPIVLDLLELDSLTTQEPVSIGRLWLCGVAHGDMLAVTVDIDANNLTTVWLRRLPYGRPSAGIGLQWGPILGEQPVPLDLSGEIEPKSNLARACIFNADLSGRDLHEVNLSRANLSDSSLSGANLRGANLRRASLHSTIFRGTDLRGADLRGVDLRWTAIDQATQLTRALYDQHTHFRESFDPNSHGMIRRESSSS